MEADWLAIPINAAVVIFAALCGYWLTAFERKRKIKTAEMGLADDIKRIIGITSLVNGDELQTRDFDIAAERIENTCRFISEWMYYYRFKDKFRIRINSTMFIIRAMMLAIQRSTTDETRNEVSALWDAKRDQLTELWNPSR